MHQSRFNFMRETRIWYSRDPSQETLAGSFENEIVLSDEFFRDVTTHSVHWLPYRCYTAKGPEWIPNFGDFGLAGQLGSADYTRPRKFRERLERWLRLVRLLWPECPAQISGDGSYLLIQPAVAFARRGA
jgi:hypothetical protein